MSGFKHNPRERCAVTVLLRVVLPARLGSAIDKGILVLFPRSAWSVVCVCTCRPRLVGSAQSARDNTDWEGADSDALS